MRPDLGPTVADWTPPPRPNAQAMEGVYARLELMSLTHAADLHAANATDDTIWDYLPYGPFADPRTYAAWVADMAGRADPVFYAVFDKEAGRWAGVASYLRIAPEAGSIEVGHINFSKPLQQTRAATEAMYLMMDWAYSAGYRRYEWKCNALNAGSRRAAHRLGFSYEGVFRQAGVVKGHNRDTSWFASIDREWPALRAAFETWLAPGNFDSAGRQRTALSALTAPILVARDPGL